MTYEQAVAVRTLQLQGVNVGDKALNEAIAIIKNTRPRSRPGEREEAQPDLLDINELAKVHAHNYASPHHVTFTLDGLRNLIAAVGRMRVMGGVVVEVKG